MIFTSILLAAIIFIVLVLPLSLFLKIVLVIVFVSIGIMGILRRCFDLLPVTNSKRGLDKLESVHYIEAKNGEELAVVELSEEEMEKRFWWNAFYSKIFLLCPVWIQNRIKSFVIARSVIFRALLSNEKSFVTANSCHVMKLGEQEYFRKFSNPQKFDRFYQSTIAPLGFLLRLRLYCELQARIIGTLLKSSPKIPLRIINIAGGTCFDTINTLILLIESGVLKNDRKVYIECLDVSDHSPYTANESIKKLKSDGVFHGFDINFRYHELNWSNYDAIEELLKTFDEEEIRIAGSEGGLFNYGSEEVIRKVLRLLGSYNVNYIFGTPNKVINKNSSFGLRGWSMLSDKILNISLVRYFHPKNGINALLGEEGKNWVVYTESVYHPWLRFVCLEKKIDDDDDDEST